MALELDGPATAFEVTAQGCTAIVRAVDTLSFFFSRPVISSPPSPFLRFRVMALQFGQEVKSMRDRKYDASSAFREKDRAFRGLTSLRLYY